ncbi:MAG: nickel ABC transporter permease subunit NikC, partial [Clostridiales bacterium]|nr:nickel ABC transporter permease subunit NikC [Clostridiales bacterium]
MWIMRKLRLSILLFLALALIFLAVFGPSLAPQDPNKINLMKTLQPPDKENLLGTDRLGRDMLSRQLFAARNSFAL